MWWVFLWQSPEIAGLTPLPQPHLSWNSSPLSFSLCRAGPCLEPQGASLSSKNGLFQNLGGWGPPLLFANPSPGQKLQGPAGLSG